MNILNEIISVLFENNTIEKVLIQNQTKSKKTPIESKDISFRLFLTPKGNINLELLGTDEYGYYFKPVGYYEFDNQNKLVGIFVLKEFEGAYKEIKSIIDKYMVQLVQFLTLEENSYIAMCSRETSNVVKKMFNSPDYNPMNHMSFEDFQVQSIISNGLKIQVRTSMMGALEANLNDDENELEEDTLVMYQNKDGISLHCQETVYIKLFEKSLLGAFK